MSAVRDEIGGPTILALTATASPLVREEIVERLNMRMPATLVRGFEGPGVLEPKGMAQKMETPRADEMAKSISANGRVTLYGIYFDSNKVEIINDSEANKMMTRDYRAPFVVPKNV